MSACVTASVAFSVSRPSAADAVSNPVGTTSDAQNTGPNDPITPVYTRRSSRTVGAQVGYRQNCLGLAAAYTRPPMCSAGSANSAAGLELVDTLGNRMLVPSVGVHVTPSSDCEYSTRCPGWSSSVGLFFHVARKVPFA